MNETSTQKASIDRSTISMEEHEHTREHTVAAINQSPMLEKSYAKRMKKKIW